MNGTGLLFDADEADFSGTVEVRDVVFSAADDGYAVLEVEDVESGEEFSLVGPVAHLSPGDQAEISGDWHTHSRYGRQLRAIGALPVDPSDRQGQISYLTSLRYIGPVRAEHLVEKHGARVLEVIAADPEGVFGTLQGVTPEHAAAAADSWNSSRAIRHLHILLAPHRLAYMAVPIHARFGDKALTTLQADPYRLTEVEGIGFVRADKIALGTGMLPESERRAQAAAVYVLSEAEAEGHTYLPVGELTSRTAKLLDLDPDPDVLVDAPGMVVDDGRAYREVTHATEITVAKTLRNRAGAPPEIDYDPGSDEDPEGELTPEQWAAVRAAFVSRVSILTGGPGVGKTVCTRAIVAEARRAEATIALCAPTGRAARRIEEATGHEAETIHRMLEWRPGGKPHYMPGNPLPVDMVIVDEASMLNLRLMEVLLDGLSESTHIIFVGDADQLPPIGAGKPFEDLIDSEIAPVVRLTQIFRQAARSMITTAAHAINRAQPPSLQPEEDQEQDFFFIDRPDPDSALDTVVEIVAERAPRRFGVDPIRDVQVLSPMYRGAVGIDSLNQQLQERLNPNGKPAFRDHFRIGDRLIYTRNSTELGLMNGSIVFLRSDDPDEEEIMVDTDDGVSLFIPYGEAEAMQVAYAISVHKAQGCEVPVVVAVCSRSHTRMLSRPLLYTAITRASKSCVLVGDPSALAISVRRNRSADRYSALADRLRGD